MIVFFDLILKEVFENFIRTSIDEIVEQEIENSRFKSLKEQFTCSDVLSFLDKIYEAIMAKLFLNEPRTAPDSTDLNQSFDSDTESQGKDLGISCIF